MKYLHCTHIYLSIYLSIPSKVNPNNISFFFRNMLAFFLNKRCPDFLIIPGGHYVINPYSDHYF